MYALAFVGGGYAFMEALSRLRWSGRATSLSRAAGKPGEFPRAVPNS
jgi:hypothetical protein